MSRGLPRWWLWLVLLVLPWLVPPWAARADDPSAYAWQQRAGNRVPVDVPLRDQSGRSVDLLRLAAGRPMILDLGYFHCPTLCGIVRDDLLSALSHSGLRAADDYTLLVVSIDPSETPATAAAARRQDLQRYPTAGAAQGWNYLTGSPTDIGAIEQAVGFRTRYDASLKQFLHPTGLVFLSPTGVVSSYLMGVGYRPDDIRRAVTQARWGTIQRSAEPVLLLCFHFDPTTGRYTLAIVKVLRLAGILTVLTLGVVVAVLLRTERRS